MSAEPSLEERVQRLEDVQAIERLMARYGECVDNDYDIEGLEQVLTDDVLWESNAFGAYSGRDEYLDGQRTISKGVEWAFHVFAPIRVELTGAAAAQGVFYLLMRATFIDAESDERVPIVLSARYDNSFVKKDGVWRCNHMKVQFHHVSRVTEGWVRERYWGS